MHEVDIEAQPLELLTRMLSPERARSLADAAATARAAIGDRTIWHVNATAHGGGVAEMLQCMLAYGLGAQIRNRWLVLSGEREFFATTKRVHNLLHGNSGDGGELGRREQRDYERVLRSNVDDTLDRVDSSDIVVLHDPQTAGMVDGIRRRGIRVVWRCHVGRDTPNEQTDEGWAFVLPYIEQADAFVFSRQQYVPDPLSLDRVVIIPPSIDPLSTKNRPLDHQTVVNVLTNAGVLGSTAPPAMTFVRRDGSSGRVRRRSLIADDARPRVDARLIVQISRWDRLKDMRGVLVGFASVASTLPDDVHLVLAGPDVSGVTDDPEGVGVLAECLEIWRALPDRVRLRTHLVSVPMEDADENAIIVNALQRHAYMVVQKSLEEGFGLTVAEALWKAKPVVAARVGGIQDQISDETDGLLIDDPADLESFAAAMNRLVKDPALATRLGSAGQERIREQFLVDRHLVQYAGLFSSLVG